MDARWKGEMEGAWDLGCVVFVFVFWGGWAWDCFIYVFFGLLYCCDLFIYLFFGGVFFGGVGGGGVTNVENRAHDVE